MKQEALSGDGYIIDQRQTDNILFGWFPSNRNGCGWIACYNLLKAVGQEPNPEELVKRLGRTLPMGGALGLHLFALVYGLRRQNLPLEFALRPIHGQLLAEQAKAGIILYYTGHRNHYVAFRREEDGGLRFFGAVPGRQEHRISLAEFYWDYVKFPLTLMITTKG